MENFQKKKDVLIAVAGFSKKVYNNFIVNAQTSGHPLLTWRQSTINKTLQKLGTLKNT